MKHLITSYKLGRHILDNLNNLTDFKCEKDGIEILNKDSNYVEQHSCTLHRINFSYKDNKGKLIHKEIYGAEDNK